MEFIVTCGGHMISNTHNITNITNTGERSKWIYSNKSVPCFVPDANDNGVIKLCDIEEGFGFKRGTSTDGIVYSKFSSDRDKMCHICFNMIHEGYTENSKGMPRYCCTRHVKECADHPKSQMKVSATKKSVPSDLLWFTGQEPSNVEDPDYLKYNNQVTDSYLPVGSILILYYDYYYYMYIMFPDSILKALAHLHSNYVQTGYVAFNTSMAHIEESVKSISDEDTKLRRIADMYRYNKKGLASDIASYSEYMGLMRYGWDIHHDEVYKTYSEEANEMAKRVQEDRDRAYTEFAEGDDDFQILSSIKLFAEKDINNVGDMLWFTGQKPHFDWGDTEWWYNLSDGDLSKYNDKIWPEDLPIGSLVALRTYSAFSVYCIISITQFVRIYSVPAYYTYAEFYNSFLDYYEYFTSCTVRCDDELSKIQKILNDSAYTASRISDFYDGVEYMGLIRYGWDTSYEEVQKHYSEGLGETTKMVMEDRERVNNLIEEGGDDDFQIL